MASLQFGDIADAVLTTQENLVKRKAFLDLQTDLQDHVAVREMWQKKKKKFNGGDVWRWQAQTDHNHSAKVVGLYESDGSAFTDTMMQCEVSARHVNAHYTYDQHEPDFQKGGHAIVDLVKTRYTAMMVSFYELMERILWTKPATSADEKTPFGMEYWVTKAATEGFKGLDPSGFSAGRGGKSSTNFPRWANWGSPYALIEKSDLIRKMRRGTRQTKFRSPVSHAQPELGSMSNGIYTNDEVIGLLEEALEDQNMNLGNDLASKDGKTLFKGTPITFAPYLDLDTENPIYMLDWKWLQVGIMAGWENNLSKPYMVPGKHNVYRVDLDASFQMICTNLRRQAVFHNPA
jgi:hypothetical protein